MVAGVTAPQAERGASVRALFIEHDHCSPPGAVGERFSQRGYQVTEFIVVPESRFRQPGVGAAFPDPAGFDAIVPLGACWAVYDDALIGRWLRPELELLRRAHQLGIPVLGICFGGQALAAALGGAVQPATGPEIGWTRLRTADPALIDAGPWYEYHYDRWQLPPGARELARTAVCSQAFVTGRSMGLQFHPEVTAAVLESWFDGGGTADLEKNGLRLTEVLAEARARERAAARRARRLVDTFLDVIATREAPAQAPPVS